MQKFITTPGNEIDSKHLGITGNNFLRRLWRTDETKHCPHAIKRAFQATFTKWSFERLCVQGRKLTVEKENKSLIVLELSTVEFQQAYATPELITGTSTMALLMSEPNDAVFDVAFLFNHLVMDAAGMRFFLRDVAAQITGRAKKTPPHSNPIINWASLWAKKANARVDYSTEEKIAALRQKMHLTQDQNKHVAFSPSTVPPNHALDAFQYNSSCTIECGNIFRSFELEATCYKALAEVSNVKSFNYLTNDACRRSIFGQTLHIFSPGGIYLPTPVVGMNLSLGVEALTEGRKLFHNESSEAMLNLIARKFIGTGADSENDFSLPYVIFNMRGSPFLTLADLETQPSTPIFCSYQCSLNFSLWQGEGEVQVSITRGANIDSELPKEVFKRLRKLIAS